MFQCHITVNESQERDDRFLRLCAAQRPRGVGSAGLTADPLDALGPRRGRWPNGAARQGSATKVARRGRHGVLRGRSAEAVSHPGRHWHGARSLRSACKEPERANVRATSAEGPSGRRCTNALPSTGRASSSEWRKRGACRSSSRTSSSNI
jgi:hypothetical protein